MLKQFLLLVTLFVSFFANADGNFLNVVPLYVRGDFNNRIFMDVTICEPGTSICQTIPKIMLDTGSVGLRIFSSLVEKSLPLLKDSEGQVQAECMSFNSGSPLWGPIAKADVKLGGELAANVSIQLIDDKFAGLPDGCGGPANSPSDIDMNGILGVGPATSDCTTEVQDCKNSIANPIALLPKDNNGELIVFGSVPEVGQKEISGSMILGLGTSPNNQLPRGSQVFVTDTSGSLNIAFNGTKYTGSFDSGTYAYDLPATIEFLKCKQVPFVCPPKPVKMSILIESLHGPDSVPFQFFIQNADLLNPDNSVFSNVAMQSKRLNTAQFTLGAPFFFGRTVFFQIAGKTSPLGIGPYCGANGL